MDEPTPDLYAEIEQLRAALRCVTDHFAQLLQDGKFPSNGRSADDQDSHEGWWDDRVAAVQNAYAALAGVSPGEWTAKHPGLYSPPHGRITL